MYYVDEYGCDLINGCRFYFTEVLLLLTSSRKKGKFTLTYSIIIIMKFRT